MYEVEKIKDCKVTGRGKLYLVKWKGYDSDEDTWQPLKNLKNAIENVKQFEEQRKKQKIKKKPKNLPNTKQNQSIVINKEIDLVEIQESVNQYLKNGISLIKPNNSQQNENLHSKLQPKKPLTSDTQNQSIKLDKIIRRQEKVTQSKKKNLKIIGMSKSNGGFIFYVNIEGKQKWMKRSEMQPLYLKELCDFYEKNLIFRQ